MCAGGERLAATAARSRCGVWYAKHRTRRPSTTRPDPPMGGHRRRGGACGSACAGPRPPIHHPPLRNAHVRLTRTHLPTRGREPRHTMQTADVTTLPSDAHGEVFTRSVSFAPSFYSHGQRGLTCLLIPMSYSTLRNITTIILYTIIKYTRTRLYVSSHYSARL